jgi:hypothetical protein
MDQKNGSESADEKFEKRLNPRERHDVTVTLDHLATVGAKWAWTSDRLDGCKGSVHLAETSHHVEDHRIFEPKYAPNGRKRPQNDSEWNIDHGDTIHPIAFLNARLATKRFRNDDLVDGKNLSVDTTVCDVSAEDAPKALLNHCWQRAVHLASTPIYINDVNERPKGDESEADTCEAKYSVTKAKLRCETLNLGVPDDSRTCPSCSVEFDSNERLRKHYFGASNQRGCCWRRIEETSHELINQALQAEVKAATKQVCQILAKHVFRDGQTQQEPLNWVAVVSILSSIVVQQSKGEATDTIQSDSTHLPISLNPQVMEAVYRRLLDRYSALPK